MAPLQTCNTQVTPKKFHTTGGTGSSIMMQPLMKEIVRPSRHKHIVDMASGMTEEELVDFTTLMRSLSIAYEQHRTAFSTEYEVQYVPKRYVSAD